MTSRHARFALLLAGIAAALPIAPLPAQPAPTAAQPIDPARDEALAYAIGIQAYIQAFPRMDLTGPSGKPPSIRNAATTAP